MGEGVGRLNVIDGGFGRTGDCRGKVLFTALADLRVCIIHGDSTMRRTIREELSGLGVHQIRECTDPSMALLLLAEFAADFCIVDWQGAPMDGVEFVNFIRNSDKSPDPKLPILMLTANANTRLVNDARNAGVDEFLAQPITRQALHARLLALMENPTLFIQSDEYRGPDRRRLRRPFVGTHQRESDVSVEEKKPTPANARNKERLAG